MARAPFDEMSCSVARTVGVLADAWTPLIVRDAYLGISRFDAMQRNLGISRKVLAARLAALVDHGVLERVAYQEHPPRHDYRLTEKGRDLAGVLLAMKAWGDRWARDGAGPPLLLRHDRCGAVAEAVPTCSACGEPVLPGEVTPLPGPGALPGPGTWEIPAALERLQAVRRASSPPSPVPGATGGAGSASR